MLTGSKSSSKSKRMLFGVIALALLCAVIAVGFANQISQHIAGRSAEIRAPGERRPNGAGASHANGVSALSGMFPAAPQTSAQFDLARNVIAGGGGTSIGSGNLVIDGTVGQPAAGTTLSNGQFSLTGGFWQPDSAATPTPVTTFG
jgi:hypothetical protein